MSDVLDEQATWMLPDRGAYRAKDAVRVVTVDQAQAVVAEQVNRSYGLARAVVVGILLPFTDHKFRNGKPCMVGSDQGCTCGYYDALKQVDAIDKTEPWDERDSQP